MHEKIGEGCLKELCPVNGSNIGGTTVDLALLRLFEKIISDTLLRKLKREKPSAFFDLYSELEEMKKSVQPDKNGRVSIRIPHSTLSQLLYAYIPRTLEQTINNESKLNEIGVELRDDKILLDVAHVKKLIENEILQIIAVLKATVENILDELSYIILVGGFAESKFLLKKFKNGFQKIKVITPEEPGLAVLKGAVLFGQNPESINTRILRLTYGIEINNPYEIGVHSESRKVMNPWGVLVCTNCFYVLIKRNESVKKGKSIPFQFNTCKPYQESIDFNFYSATTDNPMYVDDAACSLVGNVSIEIPNPSIKTLKFTVNFVFGDTTIKLIIEDVSSGISVEKNFNL